MSQRTQLLILLATALAMLIFTAANDFVSHQPIPHYELQGGVWSLDRSPEYGYSYSGLAQLVVNCGSNNSLALGHYMSKPGDIFPTRRLNDGQYIVYKLTGSLSKFGAVRFVTNSDAIYQFRDKMTLADNRIAESILFATEESWKNNPETVAKQITDFYRNDLEQEFGPDFAIDELTVKVLNSNDCNN